MSFSQLFAIFKARKWVFLAILLITVLTTVVVSLVLPKRYTAVSSVVVDVKSPDPINGMVLQGMMSPSYMATQIDIIKSQRAALSVISALRLAESEPLRAQWVEGTDGKGSYEDWLGQMLLKGLDVIPSKESNVISISYTAADPGFASVMANAFVSAYKNTTVELRAEPARQYSTLFEMQSKQIRDKFEEAQRKLSAFQQEHGLIATDERLDVETVRLNELSSQLVALQSLSAESASKKSTAGANSQESLANPVISALRTELSRQQARLSELSALQGAAHPQVVQLKETIRELQAKISDEVTRVGASLSIADSVNASRTAQVRAALDAQREKILKMKQNRDEVAVLLKDVENSQRAYELIQARLGQSTLESQTNQTNVSVLQAASLPTKPSSPNLLLNTALAIFLGFFFSAAVVLSLEYSDRRLRVVQDIKDLVDADFVGEIPFISPVMKQIDNNGGSKNLLLSSS